MTPSLPTFSIAFAINSPISLSPLADIVPTYHHIYKLQCFVNTLTVQNPSCCFQSPTMQVVAPIKKKDTQTWAISSEVLIIRALLFRFVTTASTAIFIPRLRSIAFIPAATDLHPSVNIALVRIVAQVVPAN